VTTPGGTGARLIAAVLDADAEVEKWPILFWDEGGNAKPAPPGNWAKHMQARDKASAAREQCWGYFEGRGRYEGPGRPTAEELAAWWFLGWGKARRDQLHLP
jgi:hypothetical protein